MCWFNAADMDLDGGQEMRAPRAQEGRPRRRYKAKSRTAASPQPVVATTHEEGSDSEAASAARSLMMLSSSSSSSPGSSVSSAVQVWCFSCNAFCSWP